MQPGPRTTAFIALLGSTIIVGLATGAILELQLRNRLEAEAERQLIQSTEVLEALLRRNSPQTEESWDEITDLAAGPAHARLTVIARDGLVLGESYEQIDSIQSMDNHLGRPEIEAARSAPFGVATRKSLSTGVEHLYVARQTDIPGYPGVFLRAARPSGDVSSAVWSLRFNLALVAFLALLIAIISAAVASRWIQGRLQTLVERASALAPTESAEAPGTLGGDVLSLSDRLQFALDALAQERDRREAVLQGVSDAVLSVDASLFVQTANPAARSLLSQDCLGKALFPESLRAVARVTSDTKRSQATELSNFLGTPTQLQVVATPLSGAEGVVLVVRDLTEVRRLERVRSDFVANASHELKTPITVILATAEALKNGAIHDAPMALEFTDALHRQSIRLSRMFDDIMELSRLEAGQMPLSPSPLRIEPAAQAIVGSVVSGHQPDTRITVEVDSALRAFVDKRCFDHALRNLVENAIKYSPKGSPIMVRGRTDDGCVVVDVLDEGPGIPEEHQDRVFERFYRVDKGRSRQVGGSGLGLSLVRHLTEAMHGTVEYLANQPSGSVFRLRLPIATASSEETT